MTHITIKVLPETGNYVCISKLRASSVTRILATENFEQFKTSGSRNMYDWFLQVHVHVLVHVHDDSAYAIRSSNHKHASKITPVRVN